MGQRPKLSQLSSLPSLLGWVSLALRVSCGRLADPFGMRKKKKKKGTSGVTTGRRAPGARSVEPVSGSANQLPKPYWPFASFPWLDCWSLLFTGGLSLFRSLKRDLLELEISDCCSGCQWTRRRASWMNLPGPALCQAALPNPVRR